MCWFVIASMLAIVSCAPALGEAQTQATSAKRVPADDSQNTADNICAKAIPIYQAALKSNPNDAAMHNRLGICYQQVDRMPEAIKEYNRAVKLNPRFAEAWNNLGTVYHGQRKLKNAVKNYRKAVGIKPDMAVAHRNMGVAYLAMGRVDEGIAAWRRAYMLDPGILESASGVSITAPGTKPAMQYYYFAKVSAGSGKVDEAIDYLKKARELGFRSFGKIKEDPDFKLIISDPRFLALTK
jgi:Tfp pilus assembly protein PilF